MLQRQIHIVAGLLVAALAVDGETMAIRPLAEGLQQARSHLRSLIGEGGGTAQARIRVACGNLNEPRCPEPNEQIIEANTQTRKEQVKKAQQTKDADKKLRASTGLK